MLNVYKFLVNVQYFPPSLQNSETNTSDVIKIDMYILKYMEQYTLNKCNNTGFP